MSPDLTFSYPGTAGNEINPPYPVSQMVFGPCDESVTITPNVGGLTVDIPGGLSSAEGVESALSLAKEQGVDFTSGSWRGLVGPKGLTRDALRVVYTEVS